MIKEGYVITILGESFEKKVLLFETKPNEVELEKLIKKYQGSKAFINSAEIFEVTAQ